MEGELRRHGAGSERRLGDTVEPSSRHGPVSGARAVWVEKGSKASDMNLNGATESSLGSERTAEEVQSGKSGVEGNVGKHDWLDFGSWLAQHTGKSEDGVTSARDALDVDGAREASDAGDANDASDADARVCVQSGAAPPATTSAVMAPKDCRQESNLLTSFGRQGSQEISVLLGAAGIPPSKCPVVPTKVVASLMTALYEPLVKLEVGVLTRAMESPMQLKRREKLGKGTLALYILPDDSLSLTFEAPLEYGGIDLASAQNTKEVMGIVNMNLGLNDVQNTQVNEVHGTVWEELARFPKWREHSDSAIVTVHMLKGDKTGRSFYVLAGDDAAPPQFTISPDSQRKFDDFSSHAATTRASNESSPKSRRHYFWMMGDNLEESIHALGKMKSYIKRPPTLSKISGVPESVLETVTDWAARVEELQREQETNGSSQAFSNPLKNLGAVLSRRTPHMAVHQSLTSSGTAIGAETDQGQDNESRAISIGSEVSVTANASAVFKDSRFNISCPCCLSVAWKIKSTIRVDPGDAMETDIASTPFGRYLGTSEDLSRGMRGQDVGSTSSQGRTESARYPDTFSSETSRDDTKKRSRQQVEEQMMKVAAMVATAEARCTSEVLARKAVEAIGKVRIEEWICEDFVRNTRQHRVRAKAERQRKKDLQRGYAALQAAKPLIQRAVAGLTDADPMDNIEKMAESDNADLRVHDELSDDSTQSPPDPDRPVVEPVEESTSVVQDEPGQGNGGVPARGKKISITDLSKLF